MPRHKAPSAKIVSVVAGSCCQDLPGLNVKRLGRSGVRPRLFFEASRIRSLVVSLRTGAKVSARMEKWLARVVLREMQCPRTDVVNLCS